MREEFTLEMYTTSTKPSIELTNLYEPLEKDEIYLTFEYTATQDIEGGSILYMTPNLLTEVETEVPTLTATQVWTPVIIDISEGIKELGFGSATNHGIHWTISGKVSKEESLELAVRNFCFLKRIEGDLNGDFKVDIADAVAVLEVMARDGNDPEADLNEDGRIDIADFVAVLEIMAKQ